MNSLISTRIKRLKTYLSQQYADFDLHQPTDRLLSLYSDFSKLKIVNPHGYDSNIRYWRSILLDCNLHGYLTSSEYCCLIDKNEIAEMFYRPRLGKPLALDKVIVSMMDKNELLSQEEFEKRFPLTSSSSPSWFNWMYKSTVYKPMKNWLLSSSAPNLYVVVPTIEEYSKIILHKHYEKPLCSSLDNLFTFAEFKECYGTFCFHEDTTITLSDTDIWFILRYLSSRYGIAIEDSVKTYGSMCTVIKYPERNESEIVPAEITGNDKAIINLKTTCVALHRQVNELQAKSEKFMKLSREHHANKRKPQAIYTLKKKKQIEEILDRRLKSLETMETILLKIEASQNDIQVVQAFNMGADTLRDILNSKDMNIDTVDKTMEKIQSALEGQKELDNIITQSTDEINQSFMNISDQELEEELRMIDNIHIHNDHNEADHVTVHNTPMNENNTLMHSDHSQADTTRVHRNPKNKEMAEYDNYKDKKKIPPLTESINTESELLRLQNVLSSLSAPKKKRKTMELAQ